MALKIFEQQAMALGRLFTIAANFTDPDIYFVGGGRGGDGAPLPRLVPGPGSASNSTLRVEQSLVAEFALVPDLDMACARGSAVAARNWLLRG